MIKHDPQMKIKNTEQLARGTGAKYLLVFIAHNGEYIAERWLRKPIKIDKHYEIISFGIEKGETQ